MQPIKLSVEYYDLTHQALFQGFPNASTLNLLVQNGITIDKAEFLAYMMFTEQMDLNGFRTYNDLQSRIQNRLGDIDDFLTFNSGSVQSRINPLQMMQPGFTERIGVALGLCVVNKIHGLTMADWKKIQETKGKYAHATFDFEIPIASNGNSFIQVENKGCLVSNSQTKSSSISNHFTNIEEKKNFVLTLEGVMRITRYRNLYYGTIGVLDDRPNSIAKVLLVDPPAFEIEMEAKKYKLLARLHYYLDEFKNIGVRDRITKALASRIKKIEEAPDYLRFDNNPLFGPSPERLYMDGKMFASVDTNEAFGKVFIVENKQKSSAYLIAFPKAIMRLIVRQDFNAILNYSYNPDFMNEKIQVLMRFTSKEVQQYNLFQNLEFVLNESKNKFETTYFGKLNHSSDGRIFGVLSEEQNSINEKST